jgi:hypothetical protein
MDRSPESLLNLRGALQRFAGIGELPADATLTVQQCASA